MQDTKTRSALTRLLILVALILIGAWNCNSHELRPFNTQVKTAAVDKINQVEVRPADIIFVVDNSNSMCEEQAILTENFDRFIDGLAKVDADFHLAVLSTDMVEDGTGYEPGSFRTGPGTYQTLGCMNIPDTNACDGRDLPADGILRKEDYADYKSNPETLERLKADFRCLALTGIDGSTVEMGLEVLETALKREQERIGQEGAFLRPEKKALLSIVFISDENDCSDGTQGVDGPGPVYTQVQTEGFDSACEFNRNIEDSCTGNNNQEITYTYTNAEGEEVTETKLGYQWCIQGDREIVTALKDQLDINCGPSGECPNKLISRQELYRFITDPVGYCEHSGARCRPNGMDCEEGEACVPVDGATSLGYPPNDVIVAAIVNLDNGVRYNVEDVPGGQIPSPCGNTGTLGYRYELFAKMFPEDSQVTAKICENDQSRNFADDLALIGKRIGELLGQVCLQNKPAMCTMDGAPDGGCPAGEICCPKDQTCDRVFYEGDPNREYRLCSGFKVLVGTQPEGQAFTPIPEEDYDVSYERYDECVTSPLQVRFKAIPSSDIVVKYPQLVERKED